MMISETLVIEKRFCGPPKSANGGYVCGKIAAPMRGAAEVRLKAPPPLEEELRLERANGSIKLLKGATIVAEGHRAELDLVPPAAPSFEEAITAARSYAGFTHHPFPQCFVCGPQRKQGDGMRIFPGLTAGSSIVAAPWIPDASLSAGSEFVRPEYLWAALDCTSAFAQWQVPEGRAMVLGELCARLDARITPGEKCVVAGWPLQINGRKRVSGSTIFSASGHPVAVGRATWIEVPVSLFLQ
jgi:hypothetical protein